MSLKSDTLSQIDSARKFFDRTTGIFEEKDGGFRATPESMSVVAQIAHTAHTIDWFREGAFQDRWRMDFQAMVAEMAKVETLSQARRLLADAWDRLHRAVEGMAEEKLAEPMAENPIVGTRRRAYAVDGIVDHCAHHRGALSVYARLVGKVPPMPYGDD